MTSIDLVICTRNREKTLLELLSSLSSCDDMKEVELYVIDNSELKISDQLSVERKIMEYKIFFKNTFYFTCKPGLVNARNRALIETKADLIVFIDDDIKVPKDFIKKIRSAFSDIEISGAAPLIKGLYEGDSVKNLIFRNCFPNLFGRVLITSHAFWVPSRIKFNGSVDWLPGCCMVYRKKHIEGLIFSEELQSGSSGGYSLGEDVDFSLRAGQRGKLVCISDLIIEHGMSSENRIQDLTLSRAIGEWRSYVSRKYQVTSYGATLLFEIIHFVTTCLTRPKYLKISFARWSGFRSNPMNIRRDRNE